MKVIIQRVDNANVLIDNNIKREIGKGFVVLLGITKDDTIEDIDYIIKKIINIRIFDKDNKLDLSIKDINGEILLISQFTLYANVKKGNRPSFENSLNYNDAKKMYDIFIKKLEEYDILFKTGEFGSNMKVSLVNDGPVTIIIDSKE